mgnify:CR=1 FL=1
MKKTINRILVSVSLDKNQSTAGFITCSFSIGDASGQTTVELTDEEISAIIENAKTKAADRLSEDGSEVVDGTL